MGAVESTRSREPGQVNFDTVSVTRASVYAITIFTLNQRVDYTQHTEAATCSTQIPQRLVVR